MLICQRSVAVAVVAVIVDDIAARRVGKTLPSGNVGNQDLCSSSSSFILSKWIMNSSWMQAKKLTHLLHAFVVGVLLEMFAQRTSGNMIALDVLFVDLRRLSSLQSHSLFA